MSYAKKHLQEAIEILQLIDSDEIEKAVTILKDLKSNEGRLFIIGVGGSAGNASHAVNDFRKIVNIEAYAPTDNVSEITARTNDEGWSTIFSETLKVSRLCAKDVLLIFSVGGGDLEKNISPNLIEAVDYARSVGSRIIGILGRNGGYTGKHADISILIPTVNNDNITPHSEAFQAVVWHLIVSHPKLKTKQTKWESTV